MRALVLLLATLALTACGGGDPATRSALERLEAASEKTDAQESVRFTLEATMESRDLADEPIPFTAEGVTTIGENERGSMTMDLVEMFERIIAHEVTDPEERELVEALFGDREGWQGELRFFGDEVYMRVPALTNLLGGKPWVRLDEEGGESALDIVFADSPTGFLDYVGGAAEVEELGTERIGGRQTTHYRADVDLERVAEENPDLRERIEAVIEETGQRRVPIEVWVDGDDLIRRFTFTDVTPPAEDERFPTTFTATMDFTEFGVDVDVEKPAADEVMSEDEFDRLGEES